MTKNATTGTEIVTRCRRTLVAALDTSPDSGGSVASMRMASLLGQTHLVVPVVALVGDSVFRPMNSDGPEFVPLSELETAPWCWNNRPIVANHPGNGELSANTPDQVESTVFGRVFNARVEDGRLKMDAWFDVERARAMGGDALSVIERCEAIAAGDPNAPMVEVSIGASTVLEYRPGRTPRGVAYEYIWHGVYPDHLAALPADHIGACSIEAGCGLPRAAAAHAGIQSKEITAMSEPTSPAVPITAAALPITAVAARARRPTFSGTEDTAWSAPSFAAYVSALFSGSNPPATIKAASASLKNAIAARTLLGDPKADNFRDLAFFPVVNPATGKLNGRALRAVLGGRGSQANISAAARKSAQSMARSLLKSEFGADLKAAAAANGPAIDADVTLQSLLDSPEFRSAAAGAVSPTHGSTDGMSDSDLRDALNNALYESVPAFQGVRDVWADSQTVVYGVGGDLAGFGYVQCTYDIADDGTVVLHDDAQSVAPMMTWVAATADADTATETDAHVAASTVVSNASSVPKAACACQSASHLSDGTAAPLSTSPAASSAQGGSMDNTKVKDLAGRLIACPGTEFTEAHRASLEALPENVLESLMPVKAQAKADDATATTNAVTTTAAGKPAAVAAPVAAGAAPEAATVASADAPETVSISKADFDSWRGIVAEHNVRRAAEREKLTAALLAHPNAKPAGVTAESLAGRLRIRVSEKR